ncbi:phage distal tail protein [Nocardia sp. NPDC055165]
MRIFLNDYEINAPDNGVYLDEDLEGFELPDIRTSRGQRSGQGGSYIGMQLPDSRKITLNGRVFNQSVDIALQTRRDLQAALPLYPEPVILTMVDDDGRSYIMYCQVMDFKMPIKRQRFQHYFKIELEAPDPTIYDNSAGAALTATIHKAVPGGMLFSASTPTFGTSVAFSEGMPNTTVNNPGTTTVYPVFTITGKTTNPSITNVTTGERFYLAGYAVDSGSVTVIDMFNHTVTLNGGNAFGYVPLDSEWISLVVGDNEFLFESDSSSDVSSVAMEWRPGLRGI